MAAGSLEKGLVFVCYCCTLCNKCGRADEMNAKLGKRECPSCRVIVNDNEITKCPQCGSVLPPPFPDLPVLPPRLRS